MSGTLPRLRYQLHQSGKGSLLIIGGFCWKHRPLGTGIGIKQKRKRFRRSLPKIHDIALACDFVGRFGILVSRHLSWRKETQPDGFYDSLRYRIECDDTSLHDLRFYSHLRRYAASFLRCEAPVRRERWQLDYPEAICQSGTLRGKGDCLKGMSRCPYRGEWQRAAKFWPDHAVISGKLA